MSFFCKMRGCGGSAPSCPRPAELFWSFLGAFVGIAAVAWLNQAYAQGAGLLLMIASFGASATLVYGMPAGPFAQPRSVIGGHVLSALVGVAAFKAMPELVWLAAPLAVALAMTLMHACRAFHPPGGATALIAVIGGRSIHDLGFFYAIMPVAAGAAILVLVALVVNNIPRQRQYPQYWL